jgi:hypothetical protein
MISPLKRRLIAAAVTLGVATPAFACCDMGATVAAITAMNIAVNQSLTAMHADLGRLLTGIGTAINQNDAKIVAAIEANGNADRSLAIRRQFDSQVSSADDSYSVPLTSVCADSASGGMGQISSAALSASGDLRSGGSQANNPDIDRAVNRPAVDPSSDQRRSTAIHARYCDKVDFAAYGGSKLCPAESSMPGADKRMDSLVTGAGLDGKYPNLTFSPDQVDAARMYLQNSIHRSMGRELGKGEASSPKGIEYAGLRTQFEAVLDAAGFPQRQVIADRRANSSTRDFLNDALQAASAQVYYNATASPYAKQVGYVSYAELEQFEVGRRYANTEYQVDLQAMGGDNLLREQIRVANLTNWLLLESKNATQQGAIINGQILASLARAEYAPILQLKIAELDQSLGRTK